MSDREDSGWPEAGGGKGGGRTERGSNEGDGGEGEGDGDGGRGDEFAAARGLGGGNKEPFITNYRSD